MADKILYIGAFLSDQAKADVCAALLEVGVSLRDSTTYLDHVTLKFKPTDEEVEFFRPLFGKPVTVLVTSLVVTPSCTVLGVRGIEVAGDVPAHITVCTRNGTPPKMAGPALRDAPPLERLPVPAALRTITLTYDTFPRSKS